MEPRRARNTINYTDCTHPLLGSGRNRYIIPIFDWIEPILLASKELKSCCVKKAMDK